MHNSFTGLINCLFNLYLTNAPNSFKPASYERTKLPAIHMPHTLMQRLRILAPHVICTLYNGLWSDSSSGHFTRSDMDARWIRNKSLALGWNRTIIL